MVGVAGRYGVTLISRSIVDRVGIAVDGKQQRRAGLVGALGALARADAGDVVVLAFLLGNGQVRAQAAVLFQQVIQRVGRRPGHLIFIKTEPFGTGVRPAVTGVNRDNRAGIGLRRRGGGRFGGDRKSTRLNSSHVSISYAVF